MSDYPSPPTEFDENVRNVTVLPAVQTTHRLTVGLVNYKLETMWKEVVVARFEREQT